jgi:hypothetical protein
VAAPVCPAQKPSVFLDFQHPKIVVLFGDIMRYIANITI